MGKRIDWKLVVKVVKEDVLPNFNRQGVKPTLRTIFYSLVSKNIIPNTKSSYKRLSNVLVQARKNGTFTWDFLEDRVRYALRNFSDGYVRDSEPERLEIFCRHRVREIDLSKMIDSELRYFIEGEIGYWAKQPVVPEIWIEKDALATTVQNWVRDLSVNIRVNRGYSSWTFIYENVRELKEILREHDRIVILYCGDLDPSGMDIQRFLYDALSYFGMVGKVDLIRLAVTPEQVEQYQLPPRPEDAETIAKLRRDPRSKSYKHDYVVELDALVAFVPSEFRRILREAINSYHDEKIYVQVQKETDEILKRCDETVEKYKKEAIRRIFLQAKEMLERYL